MKNIIAICLVLAALLAGCGIPPEDSAETTAAAAVETTLPPAGCYVANSDLEQQTAGAVTVFAPEIPSCYDMAVMGEGILLFSEQGSGTRFTLLQGEVRYCAAEFVTEYPVDADAVTTRITDDGIAFFDGEARKLVILDESLREITRVAVPEDMTGGPILSDDWMQMYYSVGDKLYSLDLETGIPRLLRQHSADLIPQTLLMEGSLLQCADQNGGMPVCSTENGQLVREVPGDMNIVTEGQQYLAVFPQGESVVFGTGTGIAQMLQIPDKAQLALLPESNCVVNIPETGRLACYAVSTGRCSSVLNLEASVIAVADGSEGIVWLLDAQGLLYRWDTGALPSGEDTVYSGMYYTRSNPDLAGIAQCQELALEIGERHGVEILIWEDALAVAPWDYRVTEEYSAEVLRSQLQQLDQHLGNFPEGFLAQMGETCSGVTICLVRQLEGDVELRGLDDASGLQYWVEDHAYIALSTATATEGTLYHELCHVLDTRVIGESNAYDQWEELNPSGFRYDYDYAANAMRNAGEYLRDAERCFIDTYSMSFPKEDRARVLEYAMTEGNEHYFQSRVMQAKLKQICVGLREAFGLKKSPETFLWEQYLKE